MLMLSKRCSKGHGAMAAYQGEDGIIRYDCRLCAPLGDDKSAAFTHFHETAEACQRRSEIDYQEAKLMGRLLPSGGRRLNGAEAD